MQFEPIIGFEIHSELLTHTKIFCGCKNEFGSPSNTNVCPICLGMPGVLPVLNKKAMELSLRTAIALNCEIAEETTFDRKNYYYPDLPKNYQISQNYQCLGSNGWLEFMVNGEVKRVRINNVHLEEDAGKLFHPEGSYVDYSLVDLNRAGTPLLEIVSEPDIRSKDEAHAFMQAIRNLLLYIEVSDCKMQEGSLRFELNMSVREQGDTTLPGYRVEMKNLNSMRSVLRAIDYEWKRQTQLLENQEKPSAETRLWDDVEAVSRTMRSKETAKDYRYFPEPDLVKVVVTDKWQKQIKDSLPELKPQKKERFLSEYQIPEYDAEILTSSKPLADYYEAVIAAYNEPKAVSNWIMSELLRELKERDIEIEEIKITPQQFGSMLSMIASGKISGKIAKTIFPKMMDTGDEPEIIVKKEGLIQISDENELDSIVQKVIEANPEAVAKYKDGNTKTIGFLVGQVMKETRGKANPQMVNEILQQKMGA